MHPLPYSNSGIFDENMDMESGFVGLCGCEGFLLYSVKSELLSLKLFHVA